MGRRPGNFTSPAYGPSSPSCPAQGSQAAAVTIGLSPAIEGSGRGSETTAAARTTKVGSSRATKIRCSTKDLPCDSSLYSVLAVFVMAPSWSHGGQDTGGGRFGQRITQAFGCDKFTRGCQ